MTSADAVGLEARAKGQLGAEAEAQIEGVTLKWRADVGGLCETKRSFGPERFVADCHFHT